MKYPATIKQLIDGKWQARCMASAVGDVTVQGDSRDAALTRLRDEIRYRLEWCP